MMNNSNSLPKKALGVCLGASTISMVEVQRLDDQPSMQKMLVQEHKGSPKDTFLEMIKKINPDQHKIAVTGRKFRDMIALTKITEPEAIEAALTNVYNIKPVTQHFPTAVVSAGAESFLVYAIDKFGKVAKISSGNKCASGTGEFFMQQIKRMGLTLNEAIEQAKTGTPHHVSGRCSVFCKSDCTHALNKGVPIADVTAGLCKMIAKKIMELLIKVNSSYVAIVGGVAQNQVIIDFIKDEYQNLSIPKEAPYFEALGSAIWALENECDVFPGYDKLFTTPKSSFSFLPPLTAYKSSVEFKTLSKARAMAGDVCILGLDVGSTTTKAVLIRTQDNAMLASVYLRTNGDPVGASRKCYAILQEQITESIEIIGLGVTGSGRQIAGLHAFTDGVINEIIAHAAAAAYFDPDVDTIFEIGGQDAKYTYLVNQVPCDYAMNEACSAGTGSFLEESAYESLQVKMEDIADIALQADQAPNFSDQCSAFISSDIKTALQEGISRENIIAGLVYSICINYNNRVKGNRAVGNKIFFQGGVCYNKTIPLAMAGLTGRNIIVPPEPGLMGAFGVALEVKKKIELGLLETSSFNLEALAKRTIEYLKPFVCKGGKEKCDRACTINMYSIEGKKYPFGGACNKYYNLIHKLDYDMESLDYVAKRYQLVFNKYAAPQSSGSENSITIGMNKSFRVHTLYPLFFNFFSKLGCNIVLSDIVHESGIDRATTAFCYPAQIALGLFEDLLQKEPDYIFLPHITEIHVTEEKKYRQEFQTTCMIVQGEPFYLKAAFKDRTVNGKQLQDIVLNPTLNLASGYDAEKQTFVSIAKRIGFSKKKAMEAFDFALEQQMAFFADNKELGRQALAELEANPESIGMILFGRSYNAFAPDANKGIPYKFSSRGIKVIPFDMLEYEGVPNYKGTYWEMGQRILRATQLVAIHPQLYGTYITNFMCALDSMLIQHFRDIMGQKPSLTLEVDGHTADAGINTRIDAVLDVIANYQQMMVHQIQPSPIETAHASNNPTLHESNTQKLPLPTFKPAALDLGSSNPAYIDSEGNRFTLSDPDVKVIIPSMGAISSEGFATVFRAMGIRAEALPQFDTDAFKLAMTYHSGKECLPLIILTGSLLKYLRDREKKSEKLAYFTVGSGGNCRVGQYNIFLKRLIEQRKIPDVTTLVLNNEEAYAGLGTKFRMLAWTILVIADMMEDIRWVIASHAKDKEKGLQLFFEEWEKIKLAHEGKMKQDTLEQLKLSMQRFREEIALMCPLDEVRLIGVVGEIYVRRDHFALQNIPSRLAEKGFAARLAPIHEWILYMDYCIKKGYQDPEYTWTGKIEAFISNFWQHSREKQIKKIGSISGLYSEGTLDIDTYIKHSIHLVPPHLKGEPGLSSGNALAHMLHKYCGMINIGPFGCNNSRLTESLLSPEMTLAGKEYAAVQAQVNTSWTQSLDLDTPLPFFNIETDGNPFPQIIEAQFENFCLQAGRFHQKARAYYHSREKH